jgi:hypothetical protein
MIGENMPAEPLAGWRQLIIDPLAYAAHGSDRESADLA